MKKILAIVLSIVLVAAICPLNTFALGTNLFEEGNFVYYVTNDGEAVLKNVKGASGELVIPEKLGGYPVTRIKRTVNNYLIGCYAGVSSVIMPDTVKYIERETFLSCKELTKVKLSKNLVSIDPLAFAGCSALTSIEIPDSVTRIDANAFDSCTALDSITLPDNLDFIGQHAFLNTKYYENSKNWKDDALYIGKHLIDTRDTVSGNYKVKDGTITIHNSAFANRPSLTSVTLPSSIKTIGDNAFKECSSLKDINLPNGLINIKQGAFSQCKSLTSVKIPDSVTSIGNGAFANCSLLGSITLPNRAVNIDGDAFVRTKYYSESDNWQDDALYIGKHLISVKHSKSGAYEIKKGTLSIAAYAFEDCGSLTSVTIPGEVASIGGYAFQNCTKLTSVTIPNGVKSIGNGTFRGCTSLSSATIPGSVKSIGISAFEGCTALKNVYFGGTSEQWKKLEKGNENFYLLIAKTHYKEENNNNITTEDPKTDEPIDSSDKNNPTTEPDNYTNTDATIGANSQNKNENNSQNKNENNSQNSNGNNGSYLWVIIVIAAVVAIGGAIATVIIIKKKK